MYSILQFDQLYKSFQSEHVFTRNSKDSFAIPRSTIQSQVAQLSFHPVDETECREILGQRWYVNCRRIIDLYTFLSKSKYLHREEHWGVSMIATTLYKHILDNNEQPIFHSARLIEHTIRDMKALDMLRCVDSKYAKDIHKARSYVLSIPRIKSLFSLPKLLITFGKKNIEEEVCNSCCYNVDNVVEEVGNYEDKVGISRDYVGTTKGIEKEVAEQKRLLSLLGLQEDISKANKGLRNIYRYRMTGWRPSAGICYIASKEKNHKTAHDVYREDIIQKDFGELHEWDRNASIYNLMMFLGTGVIRPNDRTSYDLYDHLNRGLQTLRSYDVSLYKTAYNIWEEYDSIVEGNIYGISKNNVGISKNNVGIEVVESVEPTRDDVKVLMMTINFASMSQIRSLVEDTINYVRTHDNRYRRKAFKFHDRFMSILKYLPNRPLTTIEDYKSLSIEILQWCRDAKALLQRMVGDIQIGSKSIFLYEAAVNIHTQALLRDQGYHCVTIYDGFYTNASYDTWWNCYVESLYRLRTLINSYRSNSVWKHGQKI